MTAAPRACATSTLASSKASFSCSLSVGASPVVPHTTRLSVPDSSSAAARRLAWLRSSSPLSSKGVAIAVRTRPGSSCVMLHLLSGQPALARNQLEHLNGVQGRAFPEIITDHPQSKAARVGEVASDASDVHGVL